MRYAAILLAGLVSCLPLVPLAACETPSPGTGQSSRGLGDLSLEGLDEAVSGELAGVTFEAADVYFRANRFEGRERVDLVFAEVPQDDCGLPLRREGRRVFIRFDGDTALPTGSTIVDRDGEGAVSVHYERELEGRWVGVGAGIARLELEESEEAGATGRLHICFDDGQESCVSGAFTARPCLSRLDGYLPREGTGLSQPPSADEAAR